jgi:hypothetical protein
MMSMMKLVTFAQNHGLNITIYPIVFDSLINRARNAAVAHFLADPSNTHLLFIDADIEFDPQDVIALLQANKQVVGAGYPQKWLDLSKYNHQSPSPLEVCTKTSVHLKKMDEVAEIMEASYITTGFLMIKREVFEKLIQSYPERKYENDIDGYHSQIAKDFFYDFFTICIHPKTKRLESEDYGFSRLWTEIGGSIHVVTNVTLKHHGWFGYQGNLYRQLKAQI